MTASEQNLTARTGAATRSRVAAFLAQHTTMTLATASAAGAPAAAAVFYAPDDDLNLFFLSEEGTRHVLDLRANPAAAATVHADGQEWRSIRGLQMAGSARPVAPGRLPHAAAVYGRRYAFVGALLAGGAGPLALAGPLARARFWVFRPRWLRLIDNAAGFGHREEMTVDEPNG